MTENNSSVGFIGMGNMGAAIYKGFSASDLSKGVTVYCYDKFKQEYNSDLENLVKSCKYILLAVKPQSVDEVLAEIVPFLTDEKVIISICAGISTEYIKEYIGERTGFNVKVVRVMPNMPMVLGEGASAVSSDGLTSAEELEFVLRIIGSSCPVVEVIPEDKMNSVICLNGSAPAFIYEFAKHFADYANNQGIEHKTALKLISQSLIGAGKMLMNETATIEELISQVSSKGGTTVAGLERLRKNGLSQAVTAACEACTRRAEELSENLSSK